MKILQHGTTEQIQNRKIQFKCNKCACIFEANNTEYKPKMDYKNDVYYHVACPECGNICLKDSINASQNYINFRGI